MGKKAKPTARVLDAGQRAHQIVVIGSGSWARATTLKGAIRLWRSYAPQGARAVNLQALMVFDSRVFEQPSLELPIDNWSDPDDPNAAHVSIDELGTIILRHAIAVRI